MSLKATPVSQCLDKKLQVMGYEIPDLLFIFSLLSVLNFLFGTSNLKLLTVWLPTLAIAIIIRIGKRGKPDNHLIHLFRFYFKPKTLCAFSESEKFQSLKTHNRKA